MYISTILIGLLGSVALAQNSSAPAAPTTTAAPTCTSTLTEQGKFGCTITNAAKIATQTIDCNGCVLTTTTIANRFWGHGPVCFNGRKTVLDAQVTATVSECS